MVGAYLKVFHILQQIHFITGLPLTSKSFDCSSMICNHTSVASSTKIDYKCNSTGVHFRRDGLAWNADEKGYIEKTAFFSSSCYAVHWEREQERFRIRLQIRNFFYIFLQIFKLDWFVYSDPTPTDSWITLSFRVRQR